MKDSVSIQGGVLQPFDEHVLVYDLLPEWCLGQPLVELKLVIAVSEGRQGFISS